MSTSDEQLRQLELSNAYLRGEQLSGVKYRHNSTVSFIDDDGNEIKGWIVSVGPIEPTPIYTVERSDGHGDEEIAEPILNLIHDRQA